MKKKCPDSGAHTWCGFQKFYNLEFYCGTVLFKGLLPNFIYIIKTDCHEEHFYSAYVKLKAAYFYFGKRPADDGKRTELSVDSFSDLASF